LIDFCSGKAPQFVVSVNPQQAVRTLSENLSWTPLSLISLQNIVRKPIRVLVRMPISAARDKPQNSPSYSQNNLFIIQTQSPSPSLISDEECQNTFNPSLDSVESEIETETRN